jgi:hypothetical protein
MTPESQNSSLLGNGLVNILAEANACNSRRAVFSVVSTMLTATQWCAKHISAAVNQHATIEKAVYSVGAAPRLYNEDLRQLELELTESAELAVCRITEKKWQERNQAVKRRLYVCCSNRLL